MQTPASAALDSVTHGTAATAATARCALAAAAAITSAERILRRPFKAQMSL